MLVFNGRRGAEAAADATSCSTVFFTSIANTDTCWPQIHNIQGAGEIQLTALIKQILIKPSSTNKPQQQTRMKNNNKGTLNRTV